MTLLERARAAFKGKNEGETATIPDYSAMARAIVQRTAEGKPQLPETGQDIIVTFRDPDSEQRLQIISRAMPADGERLSDGSGQSIRVVHNGRAVLEHDDGRLIPGTRMFVAGQKNNMTPGPWQDLLQRLHDRLDSLELTGYSTPTVRPSPRLALVRHGRKHQHGPAR